MRLIEREAYLSKLESVKGTPDIKVLTGIRRAGKSKLLESFMAHVLEENPDANIIRVDFNMLSTEELREYHALYDYVESHYIEGVSNYVAIDEVQMCDGFEKAINSLHASERYDIYITGSNAFLMSSDLATLFTGRTFGIEVFPFSLAEYMAYFEEQDPDSALDAYTRVGGMSGGYVYKTERERMAYVSDVYKTLILRDVKQKHRIRGASGLDKLADFMMDNVSNMTSARTITERMANNGDRFSNKTVGTYMDHLCEAFLFYRVRRYDLREKRYLASGNKFYLADHSFRYAELGFRNMDFGRVYENMVVVELLRRGWDVFVGVLYKKEIDFVAMRGSEKVYVQVCDDISSEDTFARETALLLGIRDAYPKVILARTRHDNYDYEGIKVVDLARWLISGDGYWDKLPQ